MDLHFEILKEHSKKQCNLIVEWVGSNQKRFDELFKLFMGTEFKVVQRSAWPVSYCVEVYPTLINKHFDKLILQLQNNDAHQAVRRNTLRMLQYATIPNEYKGIVMNCAFDFVQDFNEPIAVKAFSLSILAKLSLEFPEIIPEIKTIIEVQLPNESAAFKSSAKQFLKITKQKI